MEATMRNSSTWIIGTAVAVGITVVAVTAVAQSPVEPTQIVAQQTLTNRSESPFSESDLRLGESSAPQGQFARPIVEMNQVITPSPPLGKSRRHRAMWLRISTCIPGWLRSISLWQLS
jgi:hypothetical protein